MKQLSGFLLIVLAWLAVTSAACKKDKHPLAEAVITGFDPRYCACPTDSFPSEWLVRAGRQACCGGLMINFDNNPVPLSGNFYLVANTPVSLGITTGAAFPLYVRVEFKKTSKCGYQDIITITRFERQ